MDVVSPDIAPGVSVPVEEGFDMDEVYEVFSFLLKQYYVSSIDIVEFNPVYDKDGITAEHVNDLVEYIKMPN
jgi:ornithine decarboxylase